MPKLIFEATETPGIFCEISTEIKGKQTIEFLQQVIRVNDMQIIQILDEQTNLITNIWVPVDSLLIIIIDFV
jgi:hypothetical protein